MGIEGALLLPDAAFSDENHIIEVHQGNLRVSLISPLIHTVICQLN